jgi:hypothetical protein
MKDAKGDVIRLPASADQTGPGQIAWLRVGGRLYARDS